MWGAVRPDSRADQVWPLMEGHIVHGTFLRCKPWAALKFICGGGGGGWHALPAKEGEGVPDMGFRARPFVLCKDGCCHPRRGNTNVGPENFFHANIFLPHMCSQNDQRDVGIILSHVCSGRPPPPPPGTAGRAAPAQTPLPARRPRRGRGVLCEWASVPSAPPAKQFSSRHDSTPPLAPLNPR